jgi:hypothetical protein
MGFQLTIKNQLKASLAALMCLQAVSALAENYEVNLTRKGSNVYKIDGKEIIIQTRYCAPAPIFLDTNLG